MSTRNKYFDKDRNEISYQKWVVLRAGYSTDRTHINIPDGWVKIEAYWDGEAKNYGPNGPLVFRTRVITWIRGQGQECETYEHVTDREAWYHYRELVNIHTPVSTDVGKTRSRFAQVAEDID